MPAPLRPPTWQEVPRGTSRRIFVDELFDYFRDAGRPSLRLIAGRAKENDALAGTASAETIRRTLAGENVPRTWSTVEAIFLTLCEMAGRNPADDRFPTSSYRDGRVSLVEEVKRLWNNAVDESPAAFEQMRSAPLDDEHWDDNEPARAPLPRQADYRQPATDEPSF